MSETHSFFLFTKVLAFQSVGGNTLGGESVGRRKNFFKKSIDKIKIL
jgi:hypothetical protein